jgi:putative membrane protein
MPEHGDIDFSPELRSGERNPKQSGGFALDSRARESSMSAKLVLMALGLGLVSLGVSQVKAPARNAPRDGEDGSRQKGEVAPDSSGTDGSGIEENWSSRLTAAFVLHAAMAEIYDVQAARIALNKGQSPNLRAFAAVLIKDHTDAAGEMRAATGGFPEPKALDSEHQMLIDRLNEISDHDFDALYLKQQATGQEVARAAYTKFLEEAPNDELRAFADKLLREIECRQDALSDLMV